MVFNIYFYFRFIRKISKTKSEKRKMILVYIPFVLLVLFLIGYLLVGIFGSPDIIMSSILFGGSIYVFVLLIVIHEIVERILDSDKILTSRYADMLDRVKRLTEDSNFVLYVNLTKDLIIEKSGNTTIGDNEKSYTGFLKSLQNLLIQKIKTVEEGSFTCEGLIKKFNEGHNNVHEIILINRDGKPTFVKLEADILRQPKTGNIMAFINEKDYNEEIVDEVIVENILEKQYDFVAYLRDNSYRILAQNNSATSLPLEKEGEFSQYVESILKPIIKDANQINSLLLTNVLNEIEHNGSFETILTLNDGEIHYKQYSFYLADEQSKFLILLVSDITKEHEEQIELNNQLENALIESKRAAQAKTIFFSNMSHDIRTPMNAIISFVELAMKSDDQVVVKQYLEKVESASEHLLSIINDVLEMSRIESGKMELINVETDLKEVSKGLYDIFHLLMEKKGLEYKVDFDVKHPYVLCDKNRLNRVLLNVINNAYKFTNSGSVIVSIREESFKDNIVAFKFSIKDTGVGMSPEFSKKIYNAFERDHTVEAQNIQGTGLGMAICKAIVSLMGGEIELKTEPGKGSEFVISVSFEATQVNAVKEEETKVENDLSRLNGIRALLAEDNEINREIINLLLEQVGVSLVETVNGKEAYERLDDTFDILLTDIQMPEMNGYELAKKVRTESQYKNIPIIALTANAFKEDIDKAIENGINEVVTKPINTEELYAKLLDVLFNKKKKQ